ncbi:YPD1 (YDL235C) [Zygosaccharomyces parabailii]|nr:YPD1 (YDL235C) [Zygosaccharomyces parabailii]CDH08248.1 related to Phosphorelay intermediate protein YPD1 [Zygosaccharomyces bailii ISA1307]
MSAIPKDIINWGILNEVVSMDEDYPEFSKGLIIQFMEQAQTTFDKMQLNLDTTRNLSDLDSLGHFLKGSSAALGLQRIAWVCERIQNLGRKRESSFPSPEAVRASLVNESVESTSANSFDSGSASPQGDDTVYLKAISEALQEARNEFELAKLELSKYYGSAL